MENVYTIFNGNVDSERSVLCSIWTNKKDAVNAAKLEAEAIALEYSNDPHEYKIRVKCDNPVVTRITLEWTHTDGTTFRITDWWDVRAHALQNGIPGQRDPNDHTDATL